jgi:hypothetical protein
MPHIANHLLRRLIHCLIIGFALLQLPACQLIPGLSPAYAPTPTFPPFPQPSPILTPTLSPTVTPAPPPMIVSRQKLEDSQNLYNLKINYPFLEQVSDPRFQLFNQEVDKLVNQISQDFKKNVQPISATPDPNFSPSFLIVDFKITNGDNGLLSVLFNVGFYMSGAAHPNQYAETLNLDVAGSKVLALKDLFKPGADYLKFISDTSIQDLTKQSRLEWDSGAAPNEANFRSWNITPDGLLFSFDPYQVTSYAMGPQSVVIPYQAMKEILNPTGPLAPILH